MNAPLAIGGSILLGLVVVGALGPLLTGDAGLAIDLARDLAPPGPGAPFGRAENGVDVATALVHGARVSLVVGVLATTLSTAFGVLYGALAGFVGGKVDALLMRVVDVLLAFPGVLLAIYVAAVLPPSLLAVVAALSATGWVGFARLARGLVLVETRRDHVLAARALGASPARVLALHVLPGIAGPVLVQASFGLSTAILAEASLSFLGLGVPPGTPSWGALLDEGVAYLLVAPHLAVFPGAAIALSVLGANLAGDGLRDLLDARTRPV